MHSFHEIRDREGYYYNVRTGEVLRNVVPGAGRRGSWAETAATSEPDAPEFELLSEDVTIPFEAVQDLVVQRYGSEAPRRFLNRQVAVQPDGRVVTEEAPELE